MAKLSFATSTHAKWEILAIKYFLHEQEKSDPLGCYLPTSSSTIWRILAEHHRIYRPAALEDEPLPPGSPMMEWQIDFKDVTTVRPPGTT